LDSIAALYPAKLSTEEVTKKFPGHRAQLVNRLCESFLAIKSNAALVCTNQVREELGGNSAYPTDLMPGGKGLLHYSSIILRTRREGWIEEKGKRVGFNIRVLCRKSKVGTPYGTCLLPFRYRGDIDRMAMLIERALEAGLITQSGPWFAIEIPDVERIQEQGRNGIVNVLRERPELQERLQVILGEEPSK